MTYPARRAKVEAAMAKLTGSRLAVDVVRDAIQVCGGYGFVRELSGTGQQMPLESIYRDARLARFTRAPTRSRKGSLRGIFLAGHTQVKSAS